MYNRQNRNGYSSRGGFRGNRGFSGGGNRGRNNNKRPIDVTMLIKKAAEYVPEPAYVPQNTFADFAISEELKNSVISRGYTEPTPIQDQAIPQLLLGKDVVGIANTGTGKTAAFLLPSLNKILQDRNQRVLIVAPTRELAAQIKQEAMLFSQGMQIFTALCIGGVNIDRQIDALRRNPSIVIGTPGRLKDLKNQGKINFAGFSTIILDEVDRMLDMGFMHDVRYIISYLPQERQSIFFSATMTPAVHGIMQAFLRDPVMISVKSRETSLNVDQDVVRTNGRNKVQVLHELLVQESFQKVIVFGRTKRGVEKLSRELYQRGFDVAALHGNKNQNQRQRALEYFKSNRVTILLATDVAARGLDIADVTHVINYDLPESIEDYTHRIGRTGRANKKGIALSLVD